MHCYWSKCWNNGGGGIQPTSPFQGFYLGAEGGILNSFNSTNQNIYYDSFPPAFPAVNTANQQLNTSNNYAIGLFTLGYGKIFNDTQYLGLELGISIANNSANYYDDVSYSSYYPASTPRENLNQSNYLKNKLNYAEFDLDLKFGITAHDTTLVYGRVGAAFNREKLTSYFNMNDFDFQISQSIIGNLYINEGHNILGFRLGIGLEQLITKTLSLKLDYIATWYQSSKIAGNGTSYWSANFTPAVNGIQINSESRFTTQALMLGANLYLDDFFI